MRRGIVPALNVLAEFSADVLPQRSPLMLQAPHVLTLEEWYLKAQLLLKDVQKRRSVRVHCPPSRPKLPSCYSAACQSRTPLNRSTIPCCVDKSTQRLRVQDACTALCRAIFQSRRGSWCPCRQPISSDAMRGIWLRFNRLQTLEMIDRFGRPGGGGKDRFGIGLQQLQPMRQILRMVRPHVLRDLQLACQKRAADLGHQLLGRIGLVGEPLAEFPIETMLGAGPVHGLVRPGGVVSLGARHRRGVDEQAL